MICCISYRLYGLKNYFKWYFMVPWEILNTLSLPKIAVGTSKLDFRRCLVPNRVVFLVINQLRVKITRRFDYHSKAQNVFCPIKPSKRH